MKKVSDPVQYNKSGTWCAAIVIGAANGEGTLLHLQVFPVVGSESKHYSVAQGTAPGTWRDPV